MVASVLRSVEARLPVRLVSASIGKAARAAEVVASWFESGRIRLAGAFPKLEDELAAMTVAAGYTGTGSPDRADAMVWAMTELMKPVVEPRIRVL